MSEGTDNPLGKSELQNERRATTCAMTPNPFASPIVFEKLCLVVLACFGEKSRIAFTNFKLSPGVSKPLMGRASSLDKIEN